MAESQQKKPDGKEDKKPFHVVVAEGLIKQLEAGTAPWQRPYEESLHSTLPMNPTTGKRYNGINSMWLSIMQPNGDPRWMTYRQAAEKGYAVDIDNGLAHLDQLSDEASQALMIELSRYPEVVEAASLTLEPHAIAQYLRELATAFHTAYHAQPVLVEDRDERDARLALSTATAQVLKNGLDLLGVSAPVKM